MKTREHKRDYQREWYRRKHPNARRYLCAECDGVDHNARTCPRLKRVEARA